MRNEFTAIVEQDGPWHVAYCAEVPGANGQGKTREECLANLREAIALVLGKPAPEGLLVRAVSCFDLARDLAGSIKGLPEDLALDPKYFEKFGER